MHASQLLAIADTVITFGSNGVLFMNPVTIAEITFTMPHTNNTGYTLMMTSGKAIFVLSVWYDDSHDLSVVSLASAMTALLSYAK